MRELYRVLRTGGWAILQVPVLRETTFEDPAATSPAERLRLFGQEDHVRVYGKDYRTRLVSAGFHVTVEDFAATFPPLQCRDATLASRMMMLCTSVASCRRR